MSSSEKANLLATNVIAEQGSGVKTYRWARAGTVMMASHGVVTQSTIYIPGSLEWSPVHMYSTVPTCMCAAVRVSCAQVSALYGHDGWPQ